MLSVDLKVRGVVGDPTFTVRGDTSLGSAYDLLGGTGQIQVVRNHPSYKRPTNGIVKLRDLSIPLNLGFYLAESEQRQAAMLTDVKVDGSLCRVALGVLVETLPGADPDNVEKCINNLRTIEKSGLGSYLARTSAEDVDSGAGDSAAAQFRQFENCLQAILDDCFAGLGNSFLLAKNLRLIVLCILLLSDTFRHQYTQ